MRHRDSNYRLPCWAAAFCAVVMMTPGVASAALIASETFDYADGGVAGNNGGFGWANPWTVIDTTDGKIAGGRLVGYSDPTANQANNSRILSSPIGADGTTVWMSYIGRNDPIFANNWAGVQLFNNGAANERLYTGERFGSTNWGMERPNGGAGQAFNSSVATSGADALLLFKLEFAAGSDTVSMWVNPDVNSLGAANAVRVMNDLGMIDEVRLHQGKGGGGMDPRPELQIDNLQLGDTFADLQFVPEPGSILLGLIAAAGLCFGSRRRLL